VDATTVKKFYLGERTMTYPCRWASSLLAVAVVAGNFAPEAGAGEPDDRWPMAVQAYTFRHYSLFEAIDMAAGMGLKYIEAYPGQRFRPDQEITFSHEIGAEERQALKNQLDNAGVRLISYGVVGLGPGQVPFTDDEAFARQVFDFAADMEVDIISAYPDPTSFDLLDKLVAEYDIKIAIHNAGPVSRYSRTEDTLGFLENRHRYIGACVDTGIRIQVGEVPHESIRALGKRVISLHLKDWRHEGPETIVGEGDLDLKEIATALDEIGFDGPIILELELDPEDPLPGATKGLRNWRAALRESLQQP
jgi:sugar phosphate isomerase/epimerase